MTTTFEFLSMEVTTAYAADWPHIVVIGGTTGCHNDNLWSAAATPTKY